MQNIKQQWCVMLFGAGGLVHLAGAATTYSSQHYPVRPIRLVVPFAAGGGTDAIARILAPRFTDNMGQAWIVDNRPAAGGNVGMELAANAQPDGYTVLLGVSAPLVTNPTLYPNLPYNIARDLQPITKVTSSMNAVVVNPSVRANTLAELIALAKSAPGKLYFASAGIGSTPHMAGEMFKYKIGVNMVNVPYGGGGPAALAVIAGEVQIMFNGLASSLTHIKSGRLRGLAVTGAQRSAAAPNMPTVAESGYPGFEATTWFALLVPAKTPHPIVKQLYDEALRVVKQPDIQEALARQGNEVEISPSPEALADSMAAETLIWAKVIKSTDIKMK